MQLHLNEQGNALIEATFVLPILILLLFGIIQFGTVLTAKQALSHATYEGARLGALTNNEEKIKERIKQSIAPLEVSRLSINIQPFSHQRGSNIHIETEYQVPLTIPFLNHDELTISSQADSRSECPHSECHLFD